MTEIEVVTTLRANIKGSGRISENEFGRIARSRINREFLELRCVTINYSDRSFGDNAGTISIELPKPRHYGQTWCDKEKAIEMASNDLQAVEQAVQEYIKIKEYIEISNES